VDINRYAYAGNDPVNGSDPNGHQFLPCAACGGGLEIMKDPWGWAEWGADSFTPYGSYNEYKKSIESYNRGDYAASEYHDTMAAVGIVPAGKLTVMGLKNGGKLVANGAFKGGGKILCSFDPDTPVVTGDRLLVRIASLKSGENVLSRNEATGKTEKKTILNVMAEDHADRVLVKVVSSKIEQDTIITTREHPFYVVGRGWVPAEQLAVGDALATADGSEAQVGSVEIQFQSITAYNLEVADDHTYFVGTSKVWVHNSIPCTTGAPALLGDPFSPLEVAKRQAQSKRAYGALDELAQTFDTAKSLGFTPTKTFKFNSMGQAVYQKGNQFITRDVTSHKGGFWKLFDNQGRRSGTYNKDLTKKIGK
jgi:hypothetical protein